MRTEDVFLFVKRFLIFILASIVFIVILSLPLAKGGNKLSQDKLNNNITYNMKPDNIVIIKEIKVKVYRDKTKKIEEMSLEDYIKGVVASEMPAEFHIEALKAQAVAARTYAVTHIKSLGGSGCSKDKNADICDTVHCQAFMDKIDRMEAWPKDKGNYYWSKIEEAVNLTKGQVLKYNGEVVKGAYYFAISSGKTEDVKDVFSTSLPYLKSVESPGEEIAPKYKSTSIYSYYKLASIINEYFDKNIVSSSSLKTNIKIKSKTEAGGVKEMQIGSRTLKGSQFRTMLGLNSTNFVINFGKKDIQIVCTGYGHGVGMSQWGANVYAKGGKSYNEILTHYYQGVKIEQIN
ncbi:stage II sporulation protein D [Clostridium pascui]|uniref:stage II sporulation protein D n=1 Tax=Clostridium pascui TaxID=46609 RepID=UPI001FB01AB6|nr:stage II sporulation protein D [Clostridium pascui]MBM7870560.1 stage II sporulation protein D [Clostridium pascui]